MKPIPSWAIWLGLTLLLLVAGGSTWLLVAAFGGGSVQDKIRLEAIRLAGSIAVGTGGVAALLLTARRQRATELGLLQQEQAQRLQEKRAAEDRHDADERRITELYTAAAEQLASERPLARIAGLYALSRLGNQNPMHRQNVIDLFCACLHEPENTAPVDTDETSETVDNSTPPGEKQLKITAHRLLCQHLDERNADFWTDMDINLSHATIDNLSLDNWTVRAINLAHSRINGHTYFTGTTIKQVAIFSHAHFSRDVRFLAATLPAKPSFIRTYFGGITAFWKTNLKDPHFWSSTFCWVPSFLGVEFPDAELGGGHPFEGSRLVLKFPEFWIESLNMPRGWSIRELTSKTDDGYHWGEFVYIGDQNDPSDQPDKDARPT